MKCEFCHIQDATVHLTQVLDGSVRKMHLCESCAGERGVDFQNPASFAHLLMDPAAETPEEPVAAADLPAACPVCGLTPRMFKKTGRLGCPVCYETFADLWTPMLQFIQRGDRHVGKTPGGANAARPADLAELRRRLEQAVAEERFEDAAALRDQIAALSRAPVPAMAGGEASPV